MRKLIGKKGIAIAAIAVVIAIIGVVGVNASHSGGAVAGAVNTVLKPLKSLTSRITGMYESLYGYMYEYDKLLEENEALKKRNTDLEEGYLQYQDIVEENERLKELLEFKDHHQGYVFEQATVLSWSASNWSKMFTLNVGSGNSEVAVNDCVVTEAGALVGIVTSVDSSTCTVRSIVDTAFSASVDIGTGDSVTASGDFTLMRQGKLKAGSLAGDSGIASGDAVVTSGKGGVFPQGLLMGYVDGVYSDAGGLSMYAEVRPATELDDLLYVFVITDING
ncbi:MAG: rod shape-determining protein MreC [Oscillospiraceae bacterium]|nr:rod shape-determining protein MreC [Oscillospiraceae bacterium]